MRKRANSRGKKKKRTEKMQSGTKKNYKHLK